LVIEAQELSKHYGSVRALDGVSFRIEVGEIVGLLGPNGAGKTTAMQILTGYQQPDSGSVRISGKDIAEAPLEVKQSIGYLPETAPSYGEMIVYDYLGYVAAVQNVRDPRRIVETLKTCGLSEVAHKRIKELSMGYRQRVGLAHALIHDPQILILDEPTAGLDPNQIIEVRDLIRRISARKTIILSTHILQEVEALCDRVVIINQGRTLLDRQTSSLRESLGNRAALVLKVSGIGYTELAEKIRALPGVESVEPGESGDELTACLVHSTGERDVRPELFRLAVDGGLTLYELSREHTSVEQVFRQLTTEERDGEQTAVSGPE
jgi:ABC-2 type transport system ATP-binding protein